MKTFKQFLEEKTSRLAGDTHSVIDGLNRGKNALMNNHSHISAKIIRQDNLKPLTDKEAQEHDKAAEEARKKGDFFTGSTFGNSKARYSVQHALDHAKTVKTKKISTKGFVSQQVGDHWQGNMERAKKAIPSHDKPILIMRHSSEKK